MHTLGDSRISMAAEEILLGLIQASASRDHATDAIVAADDATRRLGTALAHIAPLITAQQAEEIRAHIEEAPILQENPNRMEIVLKALRERGLKPN